MPDTIRQKIIDALDTRMKGILSASGYETDIGLSVQDWPAGLIEDSKLPVLIYRDVSCENAIDTLVTFSHKLMVEIDALVNDDTPVETVRKIIADIDKAIGIDDQWGGIALLTERVSDQFRVELKERVYAGCKVVVVITFRTKGWDDYTQI